MAQKVLDYGSHDGSELFDSSNDYISGEPRWAARADWFIRMWGYVFTPVDPVDVPDPEGGRALLFRDSTDSDKFKVKLSGGTIVDLVTATDVDFSGLAAKAVPINADSIIVLDSADSGASKKTTFAQLKAVLTPSVASIVTGDSPYSAAYHQIILADTTGGNITVTLPDPTTIIGGSVTVKRINAANTLTIARNGTEQIEGAAANFDMPTNLESKTFTSNGTDWFITASK